MEKILFRCSSIGALMINPKTKIAQENGELSETSRTMIEELWLKNTYGFYEEVITTPMLKGILMESYSIGLVQKILGGEFRLKNKNKFSNTYCVGTPDIILSDYIEDIKTSYNIKTFFNSEMTKMYEWQLKAYMWLTGRTKARLIYVLADTPDEIITEQKKRVWFTFNCDETNPDYQRISEQIETNNNFSMIPIEKRVKVFETTLQDSDIELLTGQIGKARAYYNTLHL